MEPTLIIDGKDLLLGRVATEVAKAALQGESIALCNCKEIVMTGSKRKILEKYLNLCSMSQPTKGPIIYRSPDRFVRRVVRGMVPYKKPRGAEAFKRIRCFTSMPEEFKSKSKTIDHANVKKVKFAKIISIAEICKELGWKG